ncbi:MAG: hypothetical protein WCQ69_01620 [Bacteroidales bacterium]|jgi:predicted transcriptional regulator|nr:hypothetical protein [Bacteroidales bacterium]MDD2264037.1 hypothetical protein [Bacteroidales bacterium]MDD2831271.1 hypothetical protein [Bacteroidales bacterium]MDD3208616.1 hypothetical protein [Bacteroidales bacterium]MDD3697179.1 hypothetical protein [Bacteroidales bacterium]
MKTFIIPSVLCLIFVYPAKAQVVVTGHVSAEIVDAASISTQSAKSLEIAKSSDFAAEIDFDSYVLGEFIIHSGSDVACNVVLKPASISGSEGEMLTLETSLKNSIDNHCETLGYQHHTDGDLTLQLTGNVNTLREQRSGLYQGSYTVILAYN